MIAPTTQPVTHLSGGFDPLLTEKLDKMVDHLADISRYLRLISEMGEANRSPASSPPQSSVPLSPYVPHFEISPMASRSPSPPPDGASSKRNDLVSDIEMSDPESHRPLHVKPNINLIHATPENSQCTHPPPSQLHPTPQKDHFIPTIDSAMEGPSHSSPDNLRVTEPTPPIADFVPPKPAASPPPTTSPPPLPSAVTITSESVNHPQDNSVTFSNEAAAIPFATDTLPNIAPGTSSIVAANTNPRDIESGKSGQAPISFSANTSSNIPTGSSPFEADVSNNKAAATSIVTTNTEQAVGVNPIIGENLTANDIARPLEAAATFVRQPYSSLFLPPPTFPTQPPSTPLSSLPSSPGPAARTRSRSRTPLPVGPAASKRRASVDQSDNDVASKKRKT